MNNDLSKLVEAVRVAHADIAPTYAEYVQLAFAIATDCGERQDVATSSVSASHRPSSTPFMPTSFSPTPCVPEIMMSIWEPLSTLPNWRAWK